MVHRFVCVSTWHGNLRGAAVCQGGASAPSRLPLNEALIFMHHPRTEYDTTDSQSLTSSRTYNIIYYINCNMHETLDIYYILNLLEIN